MYGHLCTLIDMAEAARDEQTISSALKSFARAYGFERFAYLQTEGSEIRTFNSYPPEWQDIYLANRFFLVDPVIADAKRRMEAFSWSADDWPAKGVPELRRFRQKAGDFGIRSGITIPSDGSFGSKMMLTFASSSKSSDATLLRDPHHALQAVLAVHYRLRIIGARQATGGKRVLSPRESMCVMWAARGKSTYDTALLTGINARTVQHYLDNARRKLEAATVPHLVAIAKDRGLV